MVNDLFKPWLRPPMHGQLSVKTDFSMNENDFSDPDSFLAAFPALTSSTGDDGGSRTSLASQNSSSCRDEFHSMRPTSKSSNDLRIRRNDSNSHSMSKTSLLSSSDWMSSDAQRGSWEDLVGDNGDASAFGSALSPSSSFNDSAAAAVVGFPISMGSTADLNSSSSASALDRDNMVGLPIDASANLSTKSGTGTGSGVGWPASPARPLKSNSSDTELAPAMTGSPVQETAASRLFRGCEQPPDAKPVKAPKVIPRPALPLPSIPAPGSVGGNWWVGGGKK